jgi:hypothetical protein
MKMEKSTSNDQSEARILLLIRSFIEAEQGARSGQTVAGSMFEEGVRQLRGEGMSKSDRKFYADIEISDAVTWSERAAAAETEAHTLKQSIRALMRDAAEKRFFQAWTIGHCFLINEENPEVCDVREIVRKERTGEAGHDDEAFIEHLQERAT